MKFEYSVVLVLGFSLISVILWYFLNQIPIDLAKEYSVLFFFILLTGFITYLLHGKGILISPEQSCSSNFPVSIRNGIIYQRVKFRPNNLVPQKINKNLIHKKESKVLPFNYSRKSYRRQN